MSLNRRLSFRMFIILLVGGVFHGCATAPADAVNLAVSAPYTYEPIARYPYTMDAGDAVELTDGKYARTHFWTARDLTVGWLQPGTIRIEIDLRSTYAIEGVSLNSARGIKAGVSFPQRVDIFASSDGVNYRYLGDMMEDADREDGAYQIRKFTRDLAVTARYVVFFVEPKGNYTFIDEIEVLGSGVKQAPAETYPINRADLPAVRKKLVEAAHLIRAIDKELGKWTYQSGAPTSAAGDIETPDAAFRAVASDTTSQNNPVSAESLVVENSLLSDEDLLSATYARHFQYLTNYFKEPLLVWHRNPWAPFSSLDSPVVGQSRKDSSKTSALPDRLAVAQKFNETLRFDLPRQGTASEAIVLTNNSAATQSYRISLEGGASESFPVISLREARIVLLAKDELRADPLVELNDRTMVLQSGESRQLWLTVNSGDVPPGNYAAKVLLAEDGAWNATVRIPLLIRVWAAEMPQDQRLMVNTWSYLTWRPIRNIPETAVADLLAHHANVAILHPSQVPWPVNFKTEVLLSPDFSKFDRFIHLSRGADKFLFYMGFSSARTRDLGNIHPFMSAGWKALFKQWIGDWAKHVFALGLDYQDFAFYPFDEPDNSTEAGYLIEIAKLIKEVDPELQIYTTLDLGGRINAIDFEKIVELIDIFQVGVGKTTNANAMILKERKKEVWSYSSGAKTTDPVDFYRLQAWRAFKNGITGIGFWAYADTGSKGTAWDDLDGSRPDYSAIYEGDNGIVSSKRWEAWREGIEDYHLLLLARDKVRSAAERAELAARVDQVIQNPDDYAYLQETRRFLLTLASR